jgi:RNA polymerase sigma factor (sigma-70 family)
MTSPPASDWPTDADGLAGLAADRTQPQERRDRALEALTPTIRRIARRLALRFPGPYSDDFIGEAAGEVWQALAGYQPGGSFAGWCYRVLRNHLFDRFRQEQRQGEHRAKWALATQTPGLQQALEQALDRETILPPADLATLRTWPLPQRLALLSLSGLWQKVPAEEWLAWVVECRTSGSYDLPEPFPPEELLQHNDIAGRNGVLSAALGVPRNTLSVWLYRSKQRLRELQYVRALLEPSS